MMLPIGKVEGESTWLIGVLHEVGYSQNGHCVTDSLSCHVTIVCSSWRCWVWLAPVRDLKKPPGAGSCLGGFAISASNFCQ